MIDWRLNSTKSQTCTQNTFLQLQNYVVILKHSESLHFAYLFEYLLLNTARAIWNSLPMYTTRWCWYLFSTKVLSMRRPKSLTGCRVRKNDKYVLKQILQAPFLKKISLKVVCILHWSLLNIQFVHGPNKLWRINFMAHD